MGWRNGWLYVKSAPEWLYQLQKMGGGASEERGEGGEGRTESGGRL